MASRLKLHEELCELLGTRNVYFQSPSEEEMQYPCVRYSFADPNQQYADNKVYVKVNRYEGIVIDYDVDSTIPDSLLEHFERCRLGKPYVADNLNHFPFTLYY